jgi:hypothetical protein
MAACLPLLYSLVRAAHFVENAKQGIENTETYYGWRPEPDKNGNQLVVGRCTENEDIDREQDGKPCRNEVVERFHRSMADGYSLKCTNSADV